jgi:hypothetical protein
VAATTDDDDDDDEAAEQTEACAEVDDTKGAHLQTSVTEKRSNTRT